MVIECGIEIIKEHLEKFDEEIMINRDRKRYRNKGIRQTAVKTKMGTIEYSRRIYFDTVQGKHVYLLDEVMKPQNTGLYDEEICNIIEEMICNQSYRETANSISENTALEINHQDVWNIVQQKGKKEIDKIKNEKPVNGRIESKVLYEEADGDWLKLQGKDRQKYGASKEMKIGIAYDGVLYQEQKGGKRHILDNKVAYASFESAKYFRIHKEKVISSVYNTDEIQLRVKNGDGAQWIQKDDSCDCICVLDKFHRNKKITECVKDKCAAETLRELLFQNKFDDLIECIKAYINSSEDENEKANFKELLSYYMENKDALAGYYDRGIEIPPTREPGVVHHACLGSMESNVFTIIGNRMKGRRACWSINGGNNLAVILCRHYSTTSAASEFDPLENCNANPPLSASKSPKHDGKGYEFYGNVSIPSSAKFLGKINTFKQFSDLNF